ncbi:uroporphyrinogen-III C-methyltransferase [Paraferrimonas sedimenticola]|uniref:uroporphyrinogen-III C-methyltransferase n=1 Tax=Paraferrimonas sedimenticola TaxID=375674 RepID=A0AA37W0N6_9GAMM|nr:uroporphyrinogen-III C-methyltransferase [Paraferrimonas sedimenticola]GLP95653.1 uroporphyrin-III C-methyltransferase [Paraferrimonas sedimenticola]
MSLLSHPAKGTPAKVYLVGAGAGDADLLTLKAARLLAQAQCVLFDALVDQSVLDLINPNAKRIAVGKRAGRHSASQSEINQLLVTSAFNSNGAVVRLKGGDPLVFGRAAEELEALQGAGIEFEIIPGVTAASAAGAYAGIPLTHRGLSRGISMVTGQCMAKTSPARWAQFAQPEHTLVIYMGLQKADDIVTGLIQAGRAASTPAAIIVNAARPEQQRYLCPLNQLPDLAHEVKGQGPALLIIGEVVALAGQIDWYQGHTQTDAVEERHHG